jgi:hypothetical protein
MRRSGQAQRALRKVRECNQSHCDVRHVVSRLTTYIDGVATGGRCERDAMRSSEAIAGGVDSQVDAICGGEKTLHSPASILGGC